MSSFMGMNVCPNCGDECSQKEVDFGIGVYDQGGATKVDVNLKTVSDCCEAPIKFGLYWTSTDCAFCHFNGGDVKCSECKGNKIYECLDTLPFEDNQ